MSRLVEELVREHQLLGGRLREASNAGLESVEGRRLLGLAKKMLLDHLRKEDQELYPALRAAQSDPHVRGLLEVFDADLADVTRIALTFFERADGLVGLELARSFGTLFARLKHRIAAEESELYPAYDHLGSGGESGDQSP